MAHHIERKSDLFGVSIAVSNDQVIITLWQDNHIYRAKIFSLVADCNFILSFIIEDCKLKTFSTKF
jgi:hypothetical protein